MVTHNAPLSPPKSQPKETSSTPSGHKKSKHRGFYTFFIAAAIIFFAIGSALYSIKIYIQLHQGMARQIQSLTTQLASLKQQQLESKTLFDKSLSTISESQGKLQNQLNSMDKNLQSTLQQRTYQTNDWLLLKARYYIELAQINAHWSNGWQTTIALLQQADTLLATTNDQHLFKIRQTIVKDITQWQSMPKIDMPGLLSQLDAASDIIANLPLKTTTVPTDKPTATSANHKATSTWRQRLKDSVGLLEELVVVRHHDEDIFPLPSPAYESMLRESIRLYLQEAQWAILQGNDAVYQLSLKQAIKKINYAFASDATETISLLEQLQRLQQIQLTQQKPIIDKSLQLLNQFIESKNTPKSDTKSTTAGVNPL